MTEAVLSVRVQRVYWVLDTRRSARSKRRITRGAILK
jgi:hypothetical protein